MKVKPNYTFLLTSIILVLNVISFAQKKNDLPKEIINYVQNKINTDGQDGYERSEYRKLFYADLNNDGKKDAVLQMAIIYDLPGATSYAAKIFFTVFLKQNNKYRFIDEIDFSGGNINVPGLFSSIELVEIQKNIIKTKVYRYNVYDGHCCPSYTEEVEFKFVNNKLIPLREIKDEKFVYPKIGDQIDFGEFFVRVDNVEFLERIGNNYLNLEADGVFLLLDLTITNHKNYPVTLYSSFFELKDDESNTYKIAVNVLTYLGLMKRKTMIIEEISPKIPKKISFIFEVPNRSIYWLVGANSDYDLPSTICLVNSEKEYYNFKEEKK